MQMLGKGDQSKKRNTLASPTGVVFKANSDMSDSFNEDKNWATKNKDKGSNVQVASSSCCIIS